MNAYVNKLYMMLRAAEYPGMDGSLDVMECDVCDAMVHHVASLQDIAAKSDTWRLSAENWQRDFGKVDNALNEIKRALIDSDDVPTDASDTATHEAIVSTVKLALVYLHDARGSASMYARQLANLEKSTERTIADRTVELRQKIDVLESQVTFHRDTVKNLEGANEGLAQALRIALDTRGC